MNKKKRKIPQRLDADKYWDGHIYYGRIYNHALSNEEIATRIKEVTKS